MRALSRPRRPGAFGYPNLRDDYWLWGGTLDAIQQTISTASGRTIRRRAAPAPDAGLRQDGVLTEAQIADVAEYVLSLSGTRGDQQAVGRGAKIFADNCAPCHGRKARATQTLGAPDLTDELWLYGGDKATIAATLTRRPGRRDAGLGGRLDPETIKELAVYVHSLGGGQ